MTITLSHRWPMRSNLQQSNGLDAFFKSTRHHIFLKCDLNLPNMCFRLSIWPNWHRESQKYEFAKRIPRTNEAAGLIVSSSNSAQKHTWSESALRLFGPGSTWTSSPKMVPTPLILFGSNTPCSHSRNAPAQSFKGYVFISFLSLFHYTRRVSEHFCPQHWLLCHLCLY
jgi:hypothetical protein